MADKVLTCRDCGQEFIFTESEQQFFAEKGFTNEPGRCPDCRRSRRQNSNMGRSGGQRTMYQVTCAACGQATEVPFQPRGDRPVYCRDCFSANRSSQSRY
ncbi:MAG: zinc-ribbon domain containing protein [Bacteroidota bacterium]